MADVFSTNCQLAGITSPWDCCHDDTFSKDQLDNSHNCMSKSQRHKYNHPGKYDCILDSINWANTILFEEKVSS